MRVLWLTNDLPPRSGGIERFVGALLERCWPETTLVLGPEHPEGEGHDRDQPYAVRRIAGRVLPTPSTLRAVRSAAERHRPDVIVLGAGWPLGELIPALHRDPGCPVVALTHGHEAGMASVGLGPLVRHALRDADAVTTISDHTEQALAGYLPAGRTHRLHPGVDADRFTPDVDGTAFRSAWGIPEDAPLVGCVSRLVRRKGQDVLLDAWPVIRRRHPTAWLVLVGAGPEEDRLRDRARQLGPGAQVVMTGELDGDGLPGAYGALDVFAMPCRTRWFGTDVEGLGIVYLEAQACGVPPVAGRSGGAPEAVRDGETGIVVDGRDPVAVADAVAHVLDDPVRRRGMGLAGRVWVERRWSWETVADRFRGVLQDVCDGPVSVADRG